MPLFDFGYRNPSWSEQNGWTSSQAVLGFWDWEQMRHSRKKDISAGNWSETSMFYHYVSEQVNQISGVWTAIMLAISRNMNNDGFITSYFLSCSVLWRSYNKIQLHIPYIIFWNCEGAIFIFFKCTRAIVTFLLRLSCSIKTPTQHWHISYSFQENNPATQVHFIKKRSKIKDNIAFIHIPG